MYLDDLAQKYNTGKKIGIHSYTPIYSKHFDPIKHSVQKVLEIGIDTGASHRMWQDYFSNATIYGMDTRTECLINEGRIKSIFGSQSSTKDLDKLVELGPFDIIIDDAGHFSNEQIVCFEYMFSSVMSGGCYIIEDLHTSYWEHMNGGFKKQGSIVEYLKDRVDELNKFGVGYGDHKIALKEMELKGQPINYFTRNIRSILFYPCMVIIEKQ